MVHRKSAFLYHATTLISKIRFTKKETQTHTPPTGSGVLSSSAERRSLTNRTQWVDVHVEGAQRARRLRRVAEEHLTRPSTTYLTRSAY